MRTAVLYSIALILLGALLIVLSRIIDIPASGSRAVTTNALPQPVLPRIAIVIDDCGGRRSYEKDYLALSPDIVFAVLPEGAYAKRFAATLSAQGYEFIVHMPMEPHDAAEVRGMKTLTNGMPAAVTERMLSSAFTAVPGAHGMNNHTGSRFTEDAAAMRPVALFCKANSIYFLDSRTTQKSTAFDTMRANGVRTAKRDVFLDDIRTERAIRERFDALITLAKKRGSAVAIGHYTSEATLRVLGQTVPGLKAKGIALVRLSELVQ